MRRVATASFVCATLIVGLLGAPPALAEHAPPLSAFGGMEIDGNTPEDSQPAGTDPIDWDTPTDPGSTTYLQDQAAPDDIFTKGSKQEAPSGWECDEGTGGPNKQDFSDVAVFFQTHNSDQYMFFNFNRKTNTGDSHLDLEFSQSADPHPNESCKDDLPLRTDGDILVTFDTESKGGTKNLFVRAFEWDTSGGGKAEGTFVPLLDPNDPQNPAPKGSIWDGATSQDNLFGEGGLNLTQSIGEFSCGAFATVFAKGRSSTSITSAMHDYVAREDLALGLCSDTHLHKAVRNVSEGETFGGDEVPSATTASPGDVIEYRLTAHNEGPVDATNVVITEEVPEHSTLQSCSPLPDGGTCAGGPGTVLTWSFASIPSGGTEAVTFQVELDDVFPAGTTTISNTATIDTDDEEESSSNTTTVDVSAAAVLTVAKSASETVVNAGDTITYTITVTNSGDADGSTPLTDDYDQAHVTVSNISDNGGANPPSDDGDIIDWGVVQVPAMTDVTFTYDATFDKPFLDGDDTTGCDPGGFAVSNTATIEGDSATETVCVTADPAFEVTKDASQTSAVIGDVITYTITVENVGDGPGSTPVEDDYDDAHGSVSNISGEGAEAGGVITWNSGTLNPGQSVTFTYDYTVEGPFFDGDPTGTCGPGEFAVINVVTVDGDSASEQVCVVADPLFTVDKVASTHDVVVGDQVTYTITVRNDGDGPGATDVIDDYDQAHVTVTDPGGGADDGDMITWNTGTLNPGEEITFTYTVIVDGPFFDGEPAGTCGPGEFAVINVVTVDGDSDSEQVCVTATPALSIVKAADLTEASPGEEITYTITIRNDGDGPATGTTVTDSMSEHTDFASCTGDCSVSGDTVTWTIGPMDPGEEIVLTLVVTVKTTVGCLICNTATVDATNHGPISSSEVCVTGLPEAQPSGANASGSAFAAHVSDQTLAIDQTIPSGIASSQSGVGSSGDVSGNLLDIQVPLLTGDDIEADLMRATSNSTVTASPARATQTSTAEVLAVDVANGVFTADTVRAVAMTHASGTTAGWSSAGSTLENAFVDPDGRSGPEEPIAVTDTNETVDIPLNALVFGPGSFVRIGERIGSTDGPPASQLEGGTYSADLTVNMVHVHITSKPVTGGALDVVVANAVAHSDFPQVIRCEPDDAQSVSGHAFTAMAQLDPIQDPTFYGLVNLDPRGGSEHAHTEDLKLPNPGTILSIAASDTDTQGTITSTDSDAQSYAEVLGVQAVKTGGTYLVTADTLLARTASHADTNGAASTDAGTTAVNLVVNGESFTVTPDRNTEVISLPGVGFVIVNEQFCDFPGDIEVDASCSDGSHSGLTVRMIHIVVTVPDNPLGLQAGAEIIISEAHSDATFVSA